MKKNQKKQTFGAHLALLPAVLFLVMPMSAEAASFLNIPNGNPTGPAAAYGADGSSTLGPSPAIAMLGGTCPWLEPALKAEGYWAKGADGIAGNADDWAIQYKHLAGTLTLQNYFAWYGTQPGSPTYTVGDLNAFGARGGPTSAGATMALTYARAGTDPAVADTHWVQVLREKPPSPEGTLYGDSTTEPGYVYHIDNLSGPNDSPHAGDPFYDTAYYSSHTSFSDRPYHHPEPNYDWQFQTFIATASDPSPTGRTLTVYDGVWWGFTTVPEPSALALLICGSLLIYAWRLRRSGSGQLT